MKKVLGILALLALVAGGWWGIEQYREQQRIAAASDFQLVRAEVGDLTATVGATGTVRANQTILLSWETSGSVEHVGVSLGDKVSQGQALATLQQTSLPQSIILAEVDLINAQKTLDELKKPPSELALSQAQQAIANAQEAVRTAERRLANLQSAAPQLDIDQARSNLVLVENQLERAEKQFEPYANRPENDLMRATLHSNLVQAQKEYEAAARKLNNLLGTANPLDLAIAEANLAVAKAQLQEAEDHYQELLDGPSEDDVAAAEARIAAAQAILDLQRIVAPFDGTITHISLKPGDKVAPGANAFRLDDISKLYVDISVSEVDINRIQLDQEVLLTFDAIVGKEYTGMVSEVSPVGAITQGIVDFTVTVTLVDGDSLVKPGMTAAANIVASRLENVLLVPNRAVRLRDGQRVVYVLRQGQPEPVRITLGASSETMSEVTGGELKAGDEIILNPPTVLEQGGPPPFIQR